MVVKNYSEDDIKNMINKTDYEYLENITEDEIEQAAKDDPDTALSTDEELRGFKRVNPN